MTFKTRRKIVKARHQGYEMLAIVFVMIAAPVVLVSPVAAMAQSLRAADGGLTLDGWLHAALAVVAAWLSLFLAEAILSFERGDANEHE